MNCAVEGGLPDVLRRRRARGAESRSCPSCPGCSGLLNYARFQDGISILLLPVATKKI